MGYYIIEVDTERRDLVFRGTTGAPTDDENTLVTEIEQTLRGLRTIYDQRAEEFAQRFTLLAQLAKAGLVGPQSQPAFGRRMLAEFRTDILEREAGPKKNRYMATLGKACARAGGPFFALGVVAQLTSGDASAPGATADPWLMISNAGYLLAACAAGVWVSFGARKSLITFDDLSLLEGDYLYPSSRLAFAGILTLALALIFHSGAAQVSIGQFTTADVLKSPVAAGIIGFLCGFSEQALAKSIAAQASRILGI